MITVHITQQDIDRGTPEDCRDCPVWHALSRTLGHKNIVVDSARITIKGHDFNTPSALSAWLEAYDMNPGAAEPMTFQIWADGEQELIG